MKKNLLLSKMALYGDTQKDLAEATGLSHGRLNEKINEKAVFTAEEIKTIKERYSLTSDEVDEIFLS